MGNEVFHLHHGELTICVSSKPRPFGYRRHRSSTCTRAFRLSVHTKTQPLRLPPIQIIFHRHICRLVHDIPIHSVYAMDPYTRHLPGFIHGNHHRLEATHPCQRPLLLAAKGGSPEPLEMCRASLTRNGQRRKGYNLKYEEQHLYE
jgi:hypothetical protein